MSEPSYCDQSDNADEPMMPAETLRERMSADGRLWSLAFVEALREAAHLLRATESGPYESESGMGRDDWGNDSKSIDTWYAAWLEERAAQIEQEAGDE